ncbi:MAG: hypothetical protein Kow0090_14070 [Myxococcota bacterium]
MALPPLVQALLRDNLVTNEELKQAATRMRDSRESLIDTLADLKIPSEDKILNFLSDKHGHPTITLLEVINIHPPEKLIKMIPQSLAQKYQVIPLEIDKETHTLKTISVEPTNSEAISFLSMASNMPKVQPYQVIPSAYDGLYRRFYEGNLDVFGVASGILSTDVEWFLKKYAAMYRIPAVDATAENAWVVETAGEVKSLTAREKEFVSGSEMQIVRDSSMHDIHGKGVEGGRRPTTSRSPKAPPPPVRPHGYAPQEEEEGEWEGGDDLMLTNLWLSPLLVGFLRNFITAVDEAHPLGSGHSVRVADRSLALSKKLGVSPDLQQKLVYAGLLHDVGMGAGHYTLLKCYENPEMGKFARLNYAYLIDSFEDMPLPDEISAILRSRFEHYDGSGFPQGFKDDDIPLASRILAVVDAYTDLHENEKLPIDEALESLQKYQGTLFDPVVIAALSAALSMATGAFSQIALIYSSDPILCAELDIISELKLQILTANSPSIARKRLANAIVRALFIDLEGDPAEGITVAEDLMHHKACENAVLIILAPELSDELKMRVRLLPTAAVIKKPINPSEVKEKLGELLEKGATTGKIKIDKQKVIRAESTPPRRVEESASSPTPTKDDFSRGSLKTTPLAKLMRAYFAKKLTGRLTLLEGNVSGELYFEGGSIVHAICGDIVGEKAFTTLVKLKTASFWFDADTLVLEAAINRPMQQLIAYVEKVTGAAK